MATGRLGAASLSATTNTVVYTCPANTFTVATVCIVNRSSSNSPTIRIAVGPNTAGAATPDNADYIEYDSTLTPNGVLERTGIVMDNNQQAGGIGGKYITVYSSLTNVSVVVMGIETPTD